MTPVIAIPQLGPGLMRRYYRYQYESALAAAGAQVRWIGPENVGAVTDCDGLLIPGGDDVDPTLYGQAKTEQCGKQNPLRDRLDPAVLKAFLPTGKPVLGICRGMQMMNVHFGGTLYQDIKQRQRVCHQCSGKRKELVHNVTVVENTLLYAILGKRCVGVNSLHHQAVDQLGGGLTVSAHSEDGIAEAIELADHRFCVGLQWHPEMLTRKHQDHSAILSAFVNACKSLNGAV